MNSRLLDKLSRNCFGQSQYVRPNEDIEAHVSRLYNRIGAPVLTDLAITFDMEDLPAEQGKLVNRIYPRDNYDLFAGDQLVVVGRYKSGGDAKVTVRGKVGKKKQKMSFPAKFVAKSSDETNAFIEKLWAMRRVGEIIDEIDLHGKNQELINELVAISTRHGIITPYTSFLADENANVRDFAFSSRRAGIALDALGEAEGRAGFVQRELKAQLQRGRLASPSSSQSLGQGGGGFGGADAAASRTATPRAAASPSTLRFRRIDSDEVVTVETVRNIGGKTFYYRNKQWVDSITTAKQEKNAIVVKRYSKEYFDLVTKHGKDVAKYLALEGKVTLVLDGKTYSF